MFKVALLQNVCRTLRLENLLGLTKDICRNEDLSHTVWNSVQPSKQGWEGSGEPRLGSAQSKRLFQMRLFWKDAHKNPKWFAKECTGNKFSLVTQIVYKLIVRGCFDVFDTLRCCSFACVTWRHKTPQNIAFCLTKYWSKSSSSTSVQKSGMLWFYNPNKTTFLRMTTTLWQPQTWIWRSYSETEAAKWKSGIINYTFMCKPLLRDYCRHHMG